MRILQTATTNNFTTVSRNNIPLANAKNWTPPSESILLQHVCLTDASSPLHKWYSVRVVAFRVESTRVTNGAATNGSEIIVVVLAYWGADGRRSQSQVKSLDTFRTGTLPSTFWGLARLVRDKEASGYVVTLNRQFPASSRISPYSWSYDEGRTLAPLSSSSQQTATPAATPPPRPQITPPTAPRMTPTYNNPETKSKNNSDNEDQPTRSKMGNYTQKTPTKEEMELALKARVQKMVNDNMGQLIALAKAHNTKVRDSISKIINDYQNPSPNADKARVDVLMSPETLGLVRELVTIAVMDGLFIDLWQITPGFLDTIGAEQQVRDKVNHASDMSAYQDINFE